MILHEEQSIVSLYLNKSVLRTGDVLLTCTKKPLSQTIAKSTHGSYSHAALVVHDGLLFESDADGVGFTQLDISGSTDLGENHFYLALLPPDTTCAVLLRHETIDIIERDKIESTAKAVIDQYYALEYSHWSRLLKPKSKLSSLAPLLKRPIDLVEKKYDKNKIGGIFCSELVALFYHSLGLELFDQPLAPEHVSPNDLSRSSFLKIVDSGVIKQHEVSTFNPIHISSDVLVHQQDFPRKDMLGLIQHNKRLMARVAETCDFTEKCTRQMKLIYVNSLNEAIPLQFETINTLLQHKVLLISPRVADRLCSLIDDFNPLCQQLLHVCDSPTPMGDVEAKKITSDWLNVTKRLYGLKLHVDYRTMRLAFRQQQDKWNVWQRLKFVRCMRSVQRHRHNCFMLLEST